MSGGSGAVGVHVDGLHQTGRTIAGRADGGGQHAKRLKENLDGASVGHAMVGNALKGFVVSDIMTPAGQLEAQVTAAGNNTSNVASVTRNQDDEKAQTLVAPISEGGGLSRDINRQV